MATQISKLAYVDNKLGATRKGQQTTRVIYDSVVLTAGQQNIQFFTNFAGKNEFQTNLTTNKLDSSESMVMKAIQVIYDTADAGMYNLRKHALITVTIGNQVVLKDFDFSFNCASRGLAFDRLHSGSTTDNVEFRLLTDIVIPPQVNFKVEIQTSEVPNADDRMTVVLKGYGTIFSAGASF